MSLLTARTERRIWSATATGEYIIDPKGKGNPKYAFYLRRRERSPALKTHMTCAYLVKHPAGVTSGAVAGTVVAPHTAPMVLAANPYPATPVMAEASYEMTTKYSVVCTDPEPVSHA
jgi:hypothetical protein